MLNIEKYYDKLEEIANNKEGGRFAKVNDKLCWCIQTKCADCDFKRYGDHNCSLNKLKWLAADSEELTDYQKDIKDNVVNKAIIVTNNMDPNAYKIISEAISEWLERDK